MKKEKSPVKVKVKTRTKKENTKKLIRTGAFAVLFVLLLAAAAFFLAEHFGFDLFGKSKDDIPVNNGELFYDVEPDNIKSMKNYDSGLVLLTNSSVEYVDSAGRKMESNKHTYASPVMDVNGKTVLLYNRGGTEYRIEKSSSIYNEYTVGGEITCAALGKGANYAYSLNNDGGFQSHLFVYSFKGTKEFEWGSSADYCCDIALSDSGNRVAVSVLGAENAEYYSKVMLFEFSSDEPEYCVDFSGKTVYDIDFVTGTRVAVFTDSGVYLIDHSGEVETVQEYTSFEIKHSCISPNGLRCTAISLYGNEQTPLITVFDSKNRTLYSRYYYEEITGVVCNNSYVCIMLNDRIEILSKDNRVLGDINVGEECERCVLSNHTLYVLTVNGIHTYNVFFDTENSIIQTDTETSSYEKPDVTTDPIPAETTSASEPAAETTTAVETETEVYDEYGDEYDYYDEDDYDEPGEYEEEPGELLFG